MKKSVAKSGDRPSGPRLTVRVDLGGGARIGPGKIALLEGIQQYGSISGAGRAMKMSYRRAWELVENMNQNWGATIVDTAAGGAGGGGARLTDAAHKFISQYRQLEKATDAAAKEHITMLTTLCKMNVSQ